MGKNRLGATLVFVYCALGLATGCGLILGVGGEELVPETDGGDASIAAPTGPIDASGRVDEPAPLVDAPSATSPEEAGGTDASEASADLVAQYGGGRVLLNAANLVAIYAGDWDSSVQSSFQTALEPFFVFVGGSAYLSPLTQYFGMVNGEPATIRAPNFQFENAHYFDPPRDGGIIDPDTFIETSVPAFGSDTIYVVFFPSKSNLCDQLDGCSGLTQNLYLPYIRVRYDGDYVATSRAAFRELVDVITNSDGRGWSVDHAGRRYSLGQICSRSSGGGALGNEASIRFWPKQTLYGSDGMFSAISDQRHGACVSSLATHAVLGALEGDGSAALFPLIGASVPTNGRTVTPPAGTGGMSLVAGPSGLPYNGFWFAPHAGYGVFTQEYPETSDLSQWASAPVGASLPTPYTTASALGVTKQGDAEWDAFVVGSSSAVPTPAARLFYYHWDNYPSEADLGWRPMGDGTSIPGINGISSSPTVTSYAPGRLDAFVLGDSPDGARLLRLSCDDRQGGVHVMATTCNSPAVWSDLGAPQDGINLVGDPDSASWPSGVTDSGHYAVAVSAADGTIRLLRDDAGVVTWTTIAPPPGVTLVPGPSISGLGDRRYLIAVRGQDGSVWQWLSDWGQESWSKVAIASSPSAIDIASY